MRFLILLYIFGVGATINYTAIFNRYAEVWEFDDFWKRASTVEAALHFISVVGGNHSHATMQDMLAKNVKYYYETDHEEAWADDFGWWGLLSIRAYAYLVQHHNLSLANSYQQLGRDAWKKMLKLGYDYTNNSYYSYPVPHGCTNNNIAGEVGAKNTVTNALLFLLSVRLYNTFRDADYLAMAKAQWTWFQSWIRLEQFHYLRSVGNNSAVVRINAALIQERPLGGNYTNICHPGWQKGLLWSGDQGLLLAAMTEFQNSIISEFAEYLGWGIKGLLVGPDLVFREAPFLRICYGDYAEDYFGGRGIIVRNLKCETIRRFELGASINATAYAMLKAQVNNQFMENITLPVDDLAYVNRFCNVWGFCDNITQWVPTWRSEDEQNAIVQALGMDFIATAIECRS